MIGPENIEETIFRYFEGDLTVNESLNLESFIKANPEYQVDFDAWSQSTVQDEKKEYKFKDELFINERFSPKGLMGWAFGGVLLFGATLASIFLVGEFYGVEEKLSTLKVSKRDFADNKQRLTSDVDSILKKSDEDISRFVKVNIESKQNNQNIFLKPNQLKPYNSIYNSKERHQINTSIKAHVEGSAKSNINSSQGVLSIGVNTIQNISQSIEQKVNDVNQVELIQSSIEVENQSNKSLKDYGFSNKTIRLANLTLKRNSQPYIRKSNFSYENPNTPKFFFSNSRDPYLNYALAHTIEENGSFVGNFNNGDGIRTEMLYRTEWPSVTSENFTSQIISLDTKIDALKGGVGLLVNADRIGHGKLNSTAFSIIYSPKFKVKNISIEPSVKYTHNQKNIAWEQVQENDVKDPRNGVLYASIPVVPNNILKTNLVHNDLGFGILINTNKLYLGGQLDHINKATYTHDQFDQKIQVPFKISAMIGTEIIKTKESQLRISPSMNYIQYGVYSALWGNTQILYHGFFFSGGFASNQDVMASLGFTNNKVRLVYGLGFSKPREFSGLPLTGEYYESHQLSLRINLKAKK